MSERAYHQLPSSWSRKAVDYESLFMPFSAAVASTAVGLAGIGPRDRCLDVAAGTGAVTFAAIEAGATVTAIDFSEGMLALLKEKLARRGDSGVDVRCMDGQELTFEDGSFDAAGSGFGVVFFPDMDRGLREMRRVVRPGGRVFVTSTGHPGSSELQAMIGKAIVGVGGGQAVRPDWPTLASGPDELAAHLDAAGLEATRVETVTTPWPVKDPVVFWERWALESPPSAAVMKALPADLRAAAGAEFARLVEHSQKTEFDVEVLVALATR